MKSLFIQAVLCFWTVGVISKSLQSNDSILGDTELEENDDSTLKKIDIIWTRLEPIPRPRIQEHEKITSGAVNEFSQPISELESKGDVIDVGQSEASFLATEPLQTDASAEGLEDKRNAQTDESNNESTANAPTVVLFTTSSEIDSDDLLGDAMLNITNTTGDALVLHSLTDNFSTFESFTFDETALMSEGSEIALFQEVSTIGLELLLDSETKQNLILTELIDSQEITENEGLSTLSEDLTSNSAIPGFSHEAETVFNEKVTNELFSDAKSVDVATNAEEIPNELNVDNSEGEIGTELVNSQAAVPECPDPGWCIFWFFAQDTCAQDSHCLGSRICCKSGCSMTCIDVDT